MSLSKSHTLPNEEDRKAKPARLPNGTIKTLTKNYKRTEDILEEVYCDLCNGESRMQIIKKLMEGVYASQGDKKMTYRSADEYHKYALQRMKNSMALSRDEAMALILNRFETVYNDALTLGDKNAACRALENMGKIFGVYDNSPQTSVQINATEGVNISFGFNKEQEQTENED